MRKYAQQLAVARASYNSHGALSKTEVKLEGAGSLQRAALGTGAPAIASVNGWTTGMLATSGEIDRWDAEDLGPGSHHATYATEEKDGHGRVVRVTERVRVAGDIEERHVRFVYLTTGEPAAILRERGAEQVTRTFGYDTLGRMVLNQEPNAGTWRYVYSDAGALVGTSDGRGCGVNFGYDTAGRLVTEDYSPCEAHHEAYDAEPEVEYLFDFADPDAEEAFPGAGQSFTLGRMTSARDRASKVLSRTDVLGRVLEVAKKVATPDGMLGTQWFRRQVAYDGAGRPIVETTGATVNLADTLDSAVWTTYTKRGAVKQVGSTYGLLVDHVRRNAEGLTEEIKYGDGAGTTTAFLYDELRRPHAVTTFRAKLSSWNEPGHYTQQLLLQDEEFTYDRVGNPTQIRDWRVAEEWPTGAKPVTRTMTYDDLYRLTQVSLDYGGTADTWSDPFEAEAQNPGELDRPQPAPRGDFGGAGRPLQQSWTYDWLGNTASTDDDLQAFYDRSLGTIQNTGYQLTSATITSGTRSGNLNAQYDASGNLIALNVHRDGPCIPAGLCTDQHYVYEWDEVGRLAKAQRSDGPDLAVTLEYAYDGSDHRVRKSAVLAGGESRHNVYVFGALELRMAEFGSEYEVSERTEVPYLRGHGVRLGRVVHTAAPDTLEPTTRVFSELGDHLGSTSVVLDRTTGELVERTTAYAYGSVESDWRPGRWSEFREDYRFTGKEDDIQVGLTYFGKRYYAPYLGRWISADPLGVHSAGEADPNLYAYVHGRVYAAVDPVGLEIGTVIAIGAIVGAVISSLQYGYSHAQRADGTAWGLLGAASKGAATGAAGAAAGYGAGAAFTSAPVLGGAVAGAIGGAASAHASYDIDWVLQGGGRYNPAGQIATGAAVGFALGLITAGFQSARFNSKYGEGTRIHEAKDVTFRTSREAAEYAVSRYHEPTMWTGREFGGNIYRVNENTYVLSDTVVGSASSVDCWRARNFNLGDLVGEWHTHATGEYFSGVATDGTGRVVKGFQADSATAVEESYLGTPDRYMRVGIVRKDVGTDFGEQIGYDWNRKGPSSSQFTGIQSATKRFSDASRMRLGGIFAGSLAPIGDRRKW